ncbi:MAG: heme lyase CcmF/NrfE family subunit [Hyphomicrobiales bacterium]|nr:heme lyase CcmF/NrfE family subunit [Hyphomicrobiales bacterium]
MIVEWGHFALTLAFAVALVQTVAPIIGAQRGDDRLMDMAGPAAISQLALIAIAFGALIWAYVGSDFSVRNVYENSHSAKPLIYKISGAWGNHEGSMVLWSLILALLGALVAVFGRDLPARLKANTLGVQGAVSLAFLLFILTTSNPFERVLPAPFEGRGLNPILQDPALALHPPFLYAGYVGFSMAFSFAVAALLEGRIDAAWARWVRPWTLAAWVFLTIGIALGSYWAYYELGWGGWWFWDPVENASFMPWLAGTALLHSAVVMEKRDSLKVWTILLAILTFALSLVGTFLVRSGVLTSVHAFAVDPERGVFILAIMAFFTGGALTLYAWRAPQLKPGGSFALISREGGLVLNNLLLTAACGVVFIGTLYPLGLEAVTGEKISVGAPYFNAAFLPLMLPLLAALPFGPMLAWKRGDLAGAAQRLVVAAGLSLAAGVVALAMQGPGPWLAPIGAALGVWLIVGSLSELALRARMGDAAPREWLVRLAGLPRSAWGGAMAHLGLGVTVLGIVGASAWPTERIAAMKPGDAIEIAGYTATFKGVKSVTGPNYEEALASFSVARNGVEQAVLTPSKRLYAAPRTQTSEVGIMPTWAGDVYVAIGDNLGDGAHSVRVYFHPLVRLIWIGALIMSLGGALSLADRRLRIGAPARAKRRAAPAAGAA